MNPRFSLGIDLGTSNCAMAVADNDSDSTDVLQVTQIVAANQVGEMRTLPSSLYLPHPDEFPAGSFRLPWDAAGPASSASSPATMARWCRPPGHFGQVVAVQPAYRSEAARRCPGGPTSPRKSCRPSSARPATCRT